MDVRFWCEEEGIDEVGDQDEEDKGGVDIPAFDDVLELGIDLLQDGSTHSACCLPPTFVPNQPGPNGPECSLGRCRGQKFAFHSPRGLPPLG